ncbi:MAG: hypothetical protein A3F81_03200 [Nitrospinae bacterium RIFCSPLOWO2_12_FULL_39_93]|nr:MAG: hypothetical protein A3F81_03200 [Nitrospinae bacterium RIFCSPLOWO2_12_FULL_39_93]
MKKIFIISLYFAFCILYPHTVVFAVETAPRISDREIIEKLARLEEGQNALRSEMKTEINALRSEMKTEINALRSEMKTEINALRSEMKTEINALRSEMKANAEAVDKRFDDLRWTMNLFITISLVILGFVLRMQWQMHKKQAQVETTLETQKDELSFLKSLIEKLLPPRGVL